MSNLIIIIFNVLHRMLSQNHVNLYDSLKLTDINFHYFDQAFLKISQQNKDEIYIQLSVLIKLMTVLVFLHLVSLGLVQAQITQDIYHSVSTPNNLRASKMDPIDPLISSLFPPSYLSQSQSTSNQISSNSDANRQILRLSNGNTIDQEQKMKFWQFQRSFSKRYSKDQILFRFIVFLQNLREIEKHNSQNHMYQQSMNKFGDLTPQQFSTFYLMKPMENQPLTAKVVVNISGVLNKSLNRDEKGLSRRLQESNSIDYRNLIKFAKVKNQGSCGACYAFANIGAIQLNWAYKYQKKQPNLSEQQLIDCCKQSGFTCDGCITGNMGSSIDYLQKQGIALAEDYPYKQGSFKCKVGIKTKDYITQTDDSYEQIRGDQAVKYYLLNKGPLSAAINSEKWKFYKKGVFTGCPTKKIIFDHAVVIVGIQDDGVWIVRNSWGPDWGEDGYLRLPAKNNCGLTDFVFYPVII